MAGLNLRGKNVNSLNLSFFRPASSGLCRIFFSFKGGALQLDAGRDTKPALKEKKTWSGGGGGEPDTFSTSSNKLSQFPRPWAVGVPTSLTDKQTNKHGAKGGGGAV